MPEEIMYGCGHTRESLNAMGQARWGLSTIEYCITDYPVGLGLSKLDVEDLVAQAAAGWSDRCGLRIVRTENSENSNILMSTGRGPRSGFDGKYGVLAWCELPSGNDFRGQLNMKWDMAEPWSKTTGANAIALLNVTCHELGHGLGLSHTNVARQLMNPVYSDQIALPQSHDIDEVVYRYGKPLVVIPTPTPTPPPLPPAGKFIDVLVRDQAGVVWSGKCTPRAAQGNLVLGEMEVEQQE